MSERCPFCGGLSEFGHHVTGRDIAGRYLDPEFKVPICHSDHELAHDDWHTARINDVVDDTYLGSFATRLARAALFVARLAEAQPEPLGVFLGRFAAWLAEHAQRHAQSIASLDRYQPGWRQTPGI